MRQARADLRASNTRQVQLVQGRLPPGVRTVGATASSWAQKQPVPGDADPGNLSKAAGSAPASFPVTHSLLLGEQEGHAFKEKLIREEGQEEMRPAHR